MLEHNRLNIGMHVAPPLHGSIGWQVKVIGMEHVWSDHALPIST